MLRKLRKCFLHCLACFQEKYSCKANFTIATFHLHQLSTTVRSVTPRTTYLVINSFAIQVNTFSLRLLISNIVRQDGQINFLHFWDNFGDNTIEKASIMLFFCNIRSSLDKSNKLLWQTRFFWKINQYLIKTVHF